MIIKNELNYDIKIAAAKVNKAKKEFAAYIANTSIPLDERWSFFESAPDFVKEHEPYIHTFNWESKYKEISWFDNFYNDKYVTVDMPQVIDSMLDQDEDYTKQMVIDMKEEILSINLGSFVMDW